MRVVDNMDARVWVVVRQTEALLRNKCLLFTRLLTRSNWKACAQHTLNEHSGGGVFTEIWNETNTSTPAFYIHIEYSIVLTNSAICVCLVCCIYQLYKNAHTQHRPRFSGAEYSTRALAHKLHCKTHTIGAAGDWTPNTTL